MSLDNFIESENINRPDERLASEHEAWEAANLDSEDNPLIEPCDWGDTRPETLGEPLSYSREGWVNKAPTENG